MSTWMVILVEIRLSICDVVVLVVVESTLMLWPTGLGRRTVVDPPSWVSCLGARLQLVEHLCVAGKNLFVTCLCRICSTTIMLV